MGEFITHVKRLLKIRWKQADTASTSEMRDIQEESSSKKKSSSEKTFKTHTTGTRLDGGREFTDQENVQYVLPKDYQELDRLHQQHWMLKVAFQGNFEAPIEEALHRGIRVLDSGCGPGTWTLEMAEAFPNSMFHGLDMAPVFPEQIRPPNCEFRLGNLNERLPFPDNHFDYIHQRLLVIGLTAEGWEKALSELFRVLKPGGWIELKELQATFANLGPLGENLVNTWQRVLKSKGFLPDIACDLGWMLEKKGFDQVNISKLSIPLNHSGILGTLFWSDIREGLNSLKPILVAGDPITYSDENFENAAEATGAEFAEYGSVGHWFSAYGRKPLA